MKIKDLIEELKKFDGDALVVGNAKLEGREIDEVREITTILFRPYGGKHLTEPLMEVVYLSD